MKPLRVHITLRTPMMEPGNLFHLDGLLAALRVQRAEADHGAVDPRDWQHDLPLARYTSPSGSWVFQASVFRLKREGEARLWPISGGINTTTAAEHRAAGVLLLRSGKPNPAGGHFKGSFFNKPILWTELEAWCIGDKAQVESLLSECRQVGGRRGTGFGRVETITVEEVDEAACRWFDRALPADYSGPGQEELVGMIGGLRPPYWDRTLHEPMCVPQQVV